MMAGAGSTAEMVSKKRGSAADGAGWSAVSASGCNRCSSRDPGGSGVVSMLSDVVVLLVVCRFVAALGLDDFVDWSCVVKSFILL